MKISIHLMRVILIFMAPNLGMAMADEVRIPNNFQSDTPAYAEEVNENFSAVKTAVDDNFSRINEKQNRITGTCPPGQSMRVVNADGTVVCEADGDSEGDITAVNPGAFMSGGGQDGAVTLNVSGMPGVDYVESSERKYVTITGAEILSQTITAPTTGYVMAFFGAMVSIKHTANTYHTMSCWISTTGSPNANGNINSYRTYYIPATIPDGSYLSAISTFRIIPVNHGDTKIYVMGDTNANSEDTFFYNCSLNLLFFPARY